MENVIGPFEGKYEFLSNFYVIDIEYNGIVFKSTEHAYQAMKASNFEDMMLVANAETPGQCKRIGRKIKMRPDWEVAKFRIMKDVCRVKFSNPELRKQLKATGNKLIVEINNWGDVIWGKVDGVGENHLGRILMELRNEI